MNQLSTDEILIVKGFIKLLLMGVMLIFIVHFSAKIKSIQSYRYIFPPIAISILFLLFSSWMVGVGWLTYPSTHFKKLCSQAGRIDYKPLPKVDRILLERNVGMYPHRDGFSPWGLVRGSRITALEEALAGKRKGQFVAYGNSPGQDLEYINDSLSEIALEIKTTSSNAELYAEIYGEEMSFYNVKTKYVYATVKYYWNSRGILEYCPDDYYKKYQGLNVTEFAKDIIGRI